MSAPAAPPALPPTPVNGRPRPRHRLRTGQAFQWLLLTPGLLFLLLCVGVPFALLAALSFRNVDAMLNLAPGYSLHQYLTVFTSPLYVSTIGTTLWFAAASAGLCLVFGYPAAWLLTYTRSRTMRIVLYIVLVSPLLTSVVIRTFAWIVLLAQNGLINSVFLELHLINHPLGLLWNLKAVLIAYVQVMLPFVVLPLATSIGDINPSVLRASMALGASPVRTFVRVVLPLTFPGALAGTVIVFSLAAGSYVTPLLIGGRLQPLLPLAIYQQAVQLSNLPLAAALSFTLLALVVAVVGLLGWLNHRWERRMYG